MKHRRRRPRTGLATRPWMGWGVAGILSVGLPAAALLLYLQVGDPMAAATQVLAAQRAGSHESDGNDVEGMVSRLAARLRDAARRRRRLDRAGTLLRVPAALRRRGRGLPEGDGAGAQPTPAARRLRRCAGIGARRRPGRPGAGGHRRRAGHRSRTIRSRSRWPAWPRTSGAILRRRDSTGRRCWRCCPPTPTRPGRLRPISPSWTARNTAPAAAERHAKAGQRHGLDRCLIA